MSWAGGSVSSAGDVDGDGLADVLIGAQFYNDGGGGEGQAFLFLGRSLPAGRTVDLTDADHGFIGTDARDYAGESDSSAGDVNGDGLSDVLVGGSQIGSGYLGDGLAHLILSRL